MFLILFVVLLFSLKKIKATADDKKHRQRLQAGKKQASKSSFA
jgi:hypothetical protein